MATKESQVTAARAGKREWIGLAVIALPCLLYSMDLTVLHLAVPRLTADLQPTCTVSPAPPSLRLVALLPLTGTTRHPAISEVLDRLRLPEHVAR